MVFHHLCHGGGDASRDANTVIDDGSEFVEGVAHEIALVPLGVEQRCDVVFWREPRFHFLGSVVPRGFQLTLPCFHPRCHGGGKLGFIESAGGGVGDDVAIVAGSGDDESVTVSGVENIAKWVAVGIHESLDGMVLETGRPACFLCEEVIGFCAG